jgi:hypothetical protein
MLSACGLISHDTYEEEPPWKLYGFKSPYKPTHQDSLLFLAFPDTASPYIDSFFGAWEAASVRMRAEDRAKLDDTLKAAYDLFDHLCLVYPERDTLHRYVVRQASIEYCILDSSRFDSAWVLSQPNPPMENPRLVRTREFRPQFLPNERVLFSDSILNRSLNFFMNEWDGRAKGKWTPFDDSGTSKVEKKERFLRKEMFLKSFIPIRDDCSEGYHFVSYPIIDRIVFSKDLKHAKVDFTRSKKFGYIKEYSRTGNGWTFVASRRFYYIPCMCEPVHLWILDWGELFEMFDEGYLDRRRSERN